MNKTNPLVSIITPTFNSSNTIRDTLDSVLNQTYSNFEYIIIDGNSSDDTLKIIKKYETKFKEKEIIFKHISENDQGIADAWNKGLKISSGTIIGILNSDDWYEKDAISKIVKEINPDLPLVTYGECIRVNNSKEIINVINHNFTPLRIYLNFGFSHTTCFVTKKTYDKIGNFDPDFKIAIDTDWLLRCYKAKIPFIKCENKTFMRLGGISTKFKKEANQEYQKALYKNKFNPVLAEVFGALKKILLFVENKK